MGRGRTRRQFLALSAGAMLSTWLPGSAAPVRAQGLIPLNVGLGFHNLDAAAAWIAQDKQYFQKFGLDVTIVEFQGGAKSIAALVSGDVPLNLQSGVEVVNARSKGFPVTMIAGLVNKFAFDFVVSKNITGAAQLKGTKCAISSFGGSSDFAARFALRKLGLDPADVTLLPTGNESSRLAALQSGQIQSTVLTAGLDLAAFDMGYRPLLRLYDLDQPYLSSGVAVNTNWAKAHPAIVDSFLKAIVSADVFMKNRLNIAAAVALLHKPLPIKVAYLTRGFELYRDKFYQIYPMVSAPGLEFILKELKNNQPAAAFYDNSYLQALENANFAGKAGQ
jgi:ABC-type nitrate/sulfonate/bicarbonate transport system substrate-binding protein